MPQHIIVTCGVSLVENLKGDNLFNSDEFLILESLAKRTNSQECLDISSKIDHYLEIDWRSLHTLSAELKIVLIWLERSLFTRDDRVFLYTSDTELWKRLWEIISRLLQTEWFKNVHYDFIKWFVVEDELIWERAYTTFKSQAIPDFFSKLNIIRDESQKYNEEVIMCPVWGYKSLIPYSSLYAMVQGWQIKYIYEDSDDLIDLPGGSLSRFVTEELLWNEKVDLSKILKWDERFVNISLDTNLKILESLLSFIKSWDLWKLIKSPYLKDVLKKVSDKNYSWGFENWFLKDLKELDFYLKYCLLNNKKLLAIITKIKSLKDELAADSYSQRVLKTILEEISELKNENDINFKFWMLQWYKDKNRYLEFWLLAKEFFVDLVSYYVFEWKVHNKWDPLIDRKVLESTIYIVFWDVEEDKNKYSYLEWEQREKIDTLKRECDVSVSKLWMDIRNIRNATAHVWKLDFNNLYYDLQIIFKQIQFFKNYVLEH